jgi:putative ABC transport system permease protein
MQVKLGDVINPAHGDPEGHGHGQGFTIVGILKPSGTPIDRAAFVNIEGFYLLDGHAKPVGTEANSLGDRLHNAFKSAHEALHPVPPDPLALEEREVTAFLVRTSDINPRLVQRIDESPAAQAALPIFEIVTLFEYFVTPVQLLLLAVTFMICLVSGVGILVSIYNSMSDRRRDIAVMRALGAGRSTVFLVILCESLILAVGGGLLGMLLGHTLVGLAGPWVSDFTGVTVGFFTLTPGPRLSELLGVSNSGWPWDPVLSRELLIVPVMVVLAILVGLLPAVNAYRTDVSKSLG